MRTTRGQSQNWKISFLGRIQRVQRTCECEWRNVYILSIIIHIFGYSWSGLSGIRWKGHMRAVCATNIVRFSFNKLNSLRTRRLHHSMRRLMCVQRGCAPIPKRIPGPRPPTSFQCSIWIWCNPLPSQIKIDRQKMRNWWSIPNLVPDSNRSNVVAIIMQLHMASLAPCYPP